MKNNLSLTDLYGTYKEWVCKNPQTVGKLETAFKCLSYFVAGKINNSDIFTEWIYSTSNLLVLFNDQIIESAKHDASSLAKKIKIWLTVVEYSEVFIEITARKLWGQKGKQLVIFCIQSWKCAARLTLLLHHKEKILSCPPILPSSRSQNKPESHEKNKGEANGSNNMAFFLKRSGRIVRKINAAPIGTGRMWKPPPSHRSKSDAEEIEDDKSDFRSHLGGEMLYIMKPIVHLAAESKYGNSTWKPWLISLMMDVISLQLHSKTGNGGSRPQLSTSQKLELSRRRLALVLYLMRSPFYEKYSKTRIDAFLDSLAKNVPLARLICSPIKQCIPYWQDKYFYMWSS